MADEPTGELDTENTRLVLGIFRKIVDIKGITIVMTSHNPIVDEFVDVLLTLQNGSVI